MFEDSPSDEIARRLERGEEPNSVFNKFIDTSLWEMQQGIGSAIQGLLHREDPAVQQVAAIASSRIHREFTLSKTQEYILALLKKKNEATGATHSENALLRALQFQEKIRPEVSEEERTIAVECLPYVFQLDADVGFRFCDAFGIHDDTSFAETARSLIVRRNWKTLDALQHRFPSSIDHHDPSTHAAAEQAIWRADGHDEVLEIQKRFSLTNDAFASCVQHFYARILSSEGNQLQTITAAEEALGIPLNSDHGDVRRSAEIAFHLALYGTDIEYLRMLKNRFSICVGDIDHVQNVASGRIESRLGECRFAEARELQQLCDMDEATFKEIGKKAVVSKLRYGKFTEASTIKKECTLSADDFMDEESQKIIEHALKSRSSEAFPFDEFHIANVIKTEAETIGSIALYEALSAFSPETRYAFDRLARKCRPYGGTQKEEINEFIQKMRIEIVDLDEGKIKERAYDALPMLRVHMHRALDSFEASTKLQDVPEIERIRNAKDVPAPEHLLGLANVLQEADYIEHLSIDPYADPIDIARRTSRLLDALYSRDNERLRNNDRADEAYFRGEAARRRLFDARNEHELIKSLESSGAPEDSMKLYEELYRTIKDCHFEKSQRQELLPGKRYAELHQRFSEWFADTEDTLERMYYERQYEERDRHTYNAQIFTLLTLRDRLNAFLIEISPPKNVYYTFEIGGHLSRELQEQLTDLSIDVRSPEKDALGLAEKINDWRLAARKYFCVENPRGRHETIQRITNDLYQQIGEESPYATVASKNKTIFPPQNEESVTDEALRSSIDEGFEAVRELISVQRFRDDKDESAFDEAMEELENWYRRALREVREAHSKNDREKYVVESEKIHDRYFKKLAYWHRLKHMNDIGMD